MTQKNNKLLPGEEVFLEEVNIPQGLLIILITALFVFITQNFYFKIALYGLTAYYIFVWILVLVRDEIDKKNKHPPRNIY